VSAPALGDAIAHLIVLPGEPVNHECREARRLLGVRDGLLILLAGMAIVPGILLTVRSGR
jgi:hypothetical protein